ncbi:MAG: glutaminase [Novosphingobium sp.]
MDHQALVEDALRAAEPLRGQGTVASYIPALARVDPNKLGIALALADGSVHTAGDGGEPFSIQSISKVFTLGLALARVKAALWDGVGREPSGSPFNSIVQLEAEHGRPRNPLINAGAIVVSDRLLDDRRSDEAVGEILAFLREQSGDPRIVIDQEVADSESAAGTRNRALAYFIAAYGNLRNSVEDVLSVYFRQCSIAMSCAQLARAGLHLAFDGIDPCSGRMVMIPSRARRINAVMMTCGHYDNSGEFAFSIGLPGKSGVGGGILTVVPGIGTIAVWSPGLNPSGTSLAGAAMLERIVERTGWSVFALPVSQIA